MKLIGRLFGFYLMLTLISCSDDESEESEATLLGTWQSTDMVLRECEDENDNVSKTLDCPGEDCIRYTFSIDTTKARVYVQERALATGSEFETGTFSVGKTRIEFCIDNEGKQECRTSRYTINQNTLVLLSADPDTRCTREIKFVREKEPENN